MAGPGRRRVVVSVHWAGTGLRRVAAFVQMAGPDLCRAAAFFVQMAGLGRGPGAVVLVEAGHIEVWAAQEVDHIVPSLDGKHPSGTLLDAVFPGTDVPGVAFQVVPDPGAHWLLVSLTDHFSQDPWIYLIV
jgi:hypothetical protein